MYHCFSRAYIDTNFSSARRSEQYQLLVPPSALLSLTISTISTISVTLMTLSTGFRKTFEADDDIQRWFGTIYVTDQDDK